MDSLAQKIDSLPAHPGVYLFKDERGELLDVGKAANLKLRMSSYFQKPAKERYRHFRIKTVGGADDCGMMEAEELKKSLPLEGGRGRVGVT
jgi:excinuclease UvrABC nuclease subunit